VIQHRDQAPNRGRRHLPKRNSHRQEPRRHPARTEQRLGGQPARHMTPETIAAFGDRLIVNLPVAAAGSCWPRRTALSGYRQLHHSWDTIRTTRQDHCRSFNDPLALMDCGGVSNRCLRRVGLSRQSRAWIRWRANSQRTRSFANAPQGEAPGAAGCLEARSAVETRWLLKVQGRYPYRTSSRFTAMPTRLSEGSTDVGNTAATCPSRPTRYLWKFQRGTSRGRSAAAQR